MDQDASGSTPLFGVFILSLYSIFIFPYTLNKLFGGDEDDAEVVKTWSSKKEGRKRGVAARAGDKLRQAFSTKVILMWTAYMLLLWYVSAASKPLERFDPFEILQLSPDAPDADIKRAYRRLSLQYHPDKNPDPAATEYFTNHVAKAYKALTDPASAENYRKYGHPDGPQAMSISVALPEWFFSKDKDAAPLILLSLLLGGIVLPLGLAACYMGRSAQFTGPNEVLRDTVAWYWASPWAVKQQQGVGRIPETLVCAAEFVKMTTTPAQGAALDLLLRALAPSFPELKTREGPLIKKRNRELVKAHLLLLAHLVRMPVPACLAQDQAAVLQKAPTLLQELFAVAAAPRMQPGYSWLAPSVAAVEMMQCLVQAVSVEEKKRQPVLAKSADSGAALLQLPHFDADVVRALGRRRVRSLPELSALPREERRAALGGAGLGGGQVDEVETALSALPTAYVTARMVVEAEDGTELSEARALQDVVTCRINVMLWRPSYMAAGFDPDSVKGTAARAYTPNFPYPRDEHWYFLVADPASNTLLGCARVALLKAEAVGARYASAYVQKTTASAVAKLAPKGGGGGGGGGGAGGGGAAAAGAAAEAQLLAAGGGGGGQSGSWESLVDEVGQAVEVRFIAPAAGRHDLQLYVMPDSWLGADRVLPLKLRTVEPSRAEREGRVGRAAAAPAPAGKPLQRSQESEALLGGGGGGEDEGSDAGGGRRGSGSEGSGSEEEEEGEGEEEGAEWDSDEYGTEETGSEASDEERDD